MTDLAPKIPEYQNNIEAKLNSVNDYVVAALSKVTRTAQGMGQNLSQSEPAEEPQGTNERPFSVRVISSPASPLQVFGGMFGTLLEVLGTTGIVIVLVVFFLIRREDLRDRFIHLVGKGHVTVTTQMLEDAGARVSRYLSMLVSHQCHFWHFRRHRAVPDRRAQRHPVGNPGHGLEVHSLHRPVDCRCDADWPVDGDLDGLGSADPDALGCSWCWSSSATTSWSPGSMARTPACRRWRSWWRLSSGRGCGDRSGCCWRPR